MKSLRLLAFGSSLATGRDVVGRFRVREECLLPHFGDESAPKPETDAGTPGPKPSWWRRLTGLLRTSPAVTPGWNELSPGVTGAASAGEVKPDPQASPTAAANCLEQPGESCCNPFRKEAPESKPRQAEFRFAKVTVVCNDLHDADFEIVPAARTRRQAAPQVEPELPELVAQM